MKKIIYKYFFSEFIRYFAISLFTLTIIIWTIQSVNFLDLITEDGHALSIYFLYSFLTISKALTKLFPFCFLIAIVFTIIKFEKDNELIALWTSGINKITIVNLIFFISLLIMFIQLVLTNLLNPTMLNYSRSVLKNSELQFVSSLLKVRQFNDTVENLTIFVEKKNDNGIYENIFIRDEGKILTDISSESSTIYAKSGYLGKNEKNLILSNGFIQKLDSGRKINVIKFDKTVLNFSGIATKSISEPKIQETSSLEIIRCIQAQYMYVSQENCARYRNNYTDTKIEINKRIGMPIFIPLISLVCSFLLASRKNRKNLNYLHKHLFFFISVVILLTAEIAVRYSGVSWNYTLLYYMIPLIFIPLFYLALIKTFKYENLS